MTATLSPEKSTTHTDNGSALPPQYLWTREKYEQVVALGLLGPDDQVELIEGGSVQKMPQYPPRSIAIMYARAGIADYWIVNLNERVLEVRRQPGPREDAPFGFAYTEVVRLTEAEAIAPLAAVHALVAVAGLLP